MKVFLAMIFVTSLFSQLYAQGWEDQGEIENAQVVIEKSRDIVLPQAPRNFEKVPPLPVEDNNSKDLKYNFTDVNTKLPLIPTDCPKNWLVAVKAIASFLVWFQLDPEPSNT